MTKKKQKKNFTWKRVQPHLVIEDVEIQTAVRYHSHQTEKQNTGPDNTKSWQHCGAERALRKTDGSWSNFWKATWLYQVKWKESSPVSQHCHS